MSERNPTMSVPVSRAEQTLAPTLDPGRPPLILATPEDDWTAHHRDAVREAVAGHGAVLLRGLGLRDAAGAGQAFRGLADGTMPELEAFAPRTERAAGVSSVTPWPAAQQMCMHHELSYTLRFPGLMMFACLRAPTTGGETAVADAAAVLDALPTDLVERFQRDGWMLVRTYSEEIGASVAESFGTDDPAAVERYCLENGIEFEWLGDGGLRTVQRRSAVVRHPVSGERCWFNQIAFLSEWTMDEEVREFLIDVNGPDGLPFTTRFGDGSPIDEETVAVINAVYDAHTLREPWQAGDLLVVDNVRTAHSRAPYEGPRDVVAALAEPVRLADCAPEFGIRAS